MQRLEVCGAVRPICGSLGIKGLIRFVCGRCNVMTAEICVCHRRESTVGKLLKVPATNVFSRSHTWLLYRLQLIFVSKKGRLEQYNVTLWLIVAIETQQYFPFYCCWRKCSYQEYKSAQCCHGKAAALLSGSRIFRTAVVISRYYI